MGDQDPVLLDVRQATDPIVRVVVGVGRPVDRLRLLGDPAQVVARVLDREQGRAAGRGLILLDLAEAVVAEAVGDAAQRRAGQQTVLGIAGQGEGAGLGQEAVPIVLEGDGGAAVDALGGEAEAGVVGAMDAAGDGARPGAIGQQAAVVAIGRGDATGGRDRLDVAGRRM